MKRIPCHLLALIVLLGLSVFSCELIPTKCGCGEPPPPPVGTMKGYFDGNGWLSTSAIAVISDGRITITGHDESAIRFSVQGTSTGDFDFSPESVDSKNVLFFTPANANIDSASYSTGYTGGRGHISITEVNTKNKTITGSFDALVTTGKSPGLAIYGGFNQIPFVEQSSDAFEGAVNDSDFEPRIIGAKALYGKIVVNFFKENGETINLSLPSNISAGSYVPGETCNAAYISSFAVTYKAVTGSITIDDHNRELRRVSGSFNFIGESIHASDEGVIIKEAIFTVQY